MMIDIDTTLTTVEAIKAALAKAAERGRKPTAEEHEDMDGFDRVDFFVGGYEAALREFADRIP